VERRGREGWGVRCVVFRGDWLCLRLNEKIGVEMGREMLGGVYNLPTSFSEMALGFFISGEIAKEGRVHSFPR
jgi:hypothetical protein